MFKESVPEQSYSLTDKDYSTPTDGDIQAVRELLQQNRNETTKKNLKPK